LLDKIPPALRHLLFALVASALTWASNEYVPHLNGPVAAVAGAAVTILLAWVTPLTRQYGVGSPADISE
jgi:hypothetical protein